MTLLSRVTAVAEARPGDRALAGRVSWTYSDLVERVARASAMLRLHAVSGGTVALQIEAPEEAIVWTLASFAAEQAVVPLDPTWPDVRREFVVADADPVCVVVQDQDSGEVRVGRRSAGSHPLPIGSAYVMYTSGSTGMPKGVVVSHDALLKRLDGLAEVPGLSPGESMLALTSFSFDIAMAELFLPLVVGGTVVCAELGTRSDPSLLDGLGHEVDVLQATPSFWRLCLAVGWRGSPAARIWCGGEALNPGLAEDLIPLCAELWNVYGPTEATIWATAARIHSGEPIGLGAALPGSRIDLVSQNGVVVTGPGDRGEVVLSGAGIATGYLGRPELTQSRFGAVPGIAGRCYRTGDIAMYRPDGSLEFLGRVDDQVKLRGHRIELGEVESALLEIPSVDEAAVVAVDIDDPVRAHLRAFVCGRADLAQLRARLAARVPAVMIPQRVILMDRLPRTTAGKVDRAALAAWKR
jgi:D-alanine--poly(phosphoribitol) ligase subunit 1